MIEWIIEMEGFKVGIDGFKIKFLLDPNKVPVDPPGVCFFEGKAPSNTHVSIGINYASFVLGQGISLQDNEQLIYKNGDSLLLLSNILQFMIKKDGLDFTIKLIPNEKGRAGKLEILCENVVTPNEKIGNLFFQIANEVMNNISIQYSIPIGFIYFVMFYHNFEFFTFVERAPIAKKFEGIFTEARCDNDLWHLASGNYRKAWLSSNPIERFLNLYLGIEGLRSAIKDYLGLDYKTNGEIVHTKYSEPVLSQHFSINAPPRFPQLVGMTFSEILFYNPDGLRSLRNRAAHAVQLNSGIFILNTDLQSYLDYQAAIPYLNYIYTVYNNILVELSS